MVSVETQRQSSTLVFSLLRLLRPVPGELGGDISVCDVNFRQGTLGCSGDLAPLAHLALGAFARWIYEGSNGVASGLLGEGRMWSPRTGWRDAADVLAINELEPLELGPKEGLALINGTQMVTSLGALGRRRSVRFDDRACAAHLFSSYTRRESRPSVRCHRCPHARRAQRHKPSIRHESAGVAPFRRVSSAPNADIHKIRPHRGQIAVAGRLRALLHNEHNKSAIAESHRHCGKVQDAYTLRCVSGAKQRICLEASNIQLAT